MCNADPKATGREHGAPSSIEKLHPPFTAPY